MSEITKSGYKATVEQDEDAINPRDRAYQDNMAGMVCFHRRYTLGDKDHGYLEGDYGNWSELEKAITKKEKPAVILPVYMMDHSGLTISTDSERFRACDSAAWDWGQIGFIYVRKNHPELKGLSKDKAVERAEAVIKAEIEEYDQYLRGEVYCITIERMEDGEAVELVESCGGFIGEYYADQEAASMLDAAIKANKAA